jgi:NAD(P)-dependent dehydrogenase (short-subunit alcohol dehydrogenase family)
MKRWTAAGMPRQTGRLVIVTGANSGLGYETALELARAGANVIVASRSVAKGQAAVEKIKAQIPGAIVIFEPLDLASLVSVAAFAERMKASYQSLDILINNAGVMALPQRQTTADGFEMQLGVNYFGHFALTAQLLPLLRTAPAPRTVQLSSIAHKRGQIDFTDLQSAGSYVPWKVYSQSKLAMLMFAFELQRRSDAGGWGILSTAAHPGVALTELLNNGPGARSPAAIGSRLIAPILFHPAAAGALPSLYAATSPEAKAGGYYGPQGFMDMKGPPGPAKAMPQAKNLAVARQLWDVSEQLTGVRFGL